MQRRFKATFQLRARSPRTFGQQNYLELTNDTAKKWKQMSDSEKDPFVSGYAISQSQFHIKQLPICGFTMFARGLPALSRPNLEAAWWKLSEADRHNFVVAAIEKKHDTPKNPTRSQRLRPIDFFKASLKRRDLKDVEIRKMWRKMDFVSQDPFRSQYFIKRALTGYKEDSRPCGFAFFAKQSSSTLVSQREEEWNALSNDERHKFAVAALNGKTKVRTSPFQLFRDTLADKTIQINRNLAMGCWNALDFTEKDHYESLCAIKKNLSSPRTEKLCGFLVFARTHAGSSFPQLTSTWLQLSDVEKRVFVMKACEELKLMVPKTPFQLFLKKYDWLTYTDAAKRWRFMNLYEKDHYMSLFAIEKQLRSTQKIKELCGFLSFARDQADAPFQQLKATWLQFSDEERRVFVLKACEERQSMLLSIKKTKTTPSNDASSLAPSDSVRWQVASDLKDLDE